MILPIRSKNPPESFPGVTIALIVINVVVYGLTTQDGLIAKESVVMEWGLKGSQFDFLHMMSSMFLHGSFWHLLGNMWFLYLFGFSVEGRLKAPKFAILYFVSGIAGDCLHQVVLGQSSPDIPSIGASGAIMGVLGAGLYMFPFAGITIFYRFFLWGTADWPLWGVALIYLGLDALIAMLGAADGVGHFAHLGGAGAGFLLAMIMGGKRDSSEASAAKAMLSDTKDLGVLAPYEFAAIAKNDTDNPLLALHWIQSASRGVGGPSVEARTYFNRMLPRIVQEQDPRVVGSTMLMLAMNQSELPSHYLMSVAMRCEQISEFRVAMSLYDMALKNPHTPPADREAATYRQALMLERMFNDPPRAASAYQNFVNQYPMSPLADQARTRIKNLTGK